MRAPQRVPRAPGERGARARLCAPHGGCGHLAMLNAIRGVFGLLSCFYCTASVALSGKAWAHPRSRAFFRAICLHSLCPMPGRARCPGPVHHRLGPSWLAPPLPPPEPPICRRPVRTGLPRPGPPSDSTASVLWGPCARTHAHAPRVAGRVSRRRAALSGRVPAALCPAPVFLAPHPSQGAGMPQPPKVGLAPPLQPPTSGARAPPPTSHRFCLACAAHVSAYVPRVPPPARARVHFQHANAAIVRPRLPCRRIQALGASGEPVGALSCRARLQVPLPFRHSVGSVFSHDCLPS